MDTLYVFSKDTVVVKDSLIIRDTIHSVDTLFVKDTTHHVDTLVIDHRDTVALVKPGETGNYAFFVPGSQFFAYELTNANLKGTGNVYSSFTNDKDGSVNVSTVRLASQYVLVVETGFYVDYVTGKYSDAPISLRMVVDLMRQEKAYPSYLTELEYERLHYMVNNVISESTGRKFNPLAAKRVIQKDLINAFYRDDSDVSEYLDQLDLGDYVYDEDIQIFDERWGGFLAILIALQGDRSAPEMTVFLSNLQDKQWIKEGVLNQDLLTEMAEWARDAEQNGRYAEIRKQLEARNLGPVPDFEKHLTNFWTKQLEEK